MAKDVGYTKNPGILEEGFYEGRVRVGRKPSGMPDYRPVAIWIEYNAPPDPDNPEERLDRSWRWMAWQNERAVDPYECWPFCGRRLTLDEYNEIRALGHVGDYDAND